MCLLILIALVAEILKKCSPQLYCLATLNQLHCNN